MEQLKSLNHVLSNVLNYRNKICEKLEKDYKSTVYDRLMLCPILAVLLYGDTTEYFDILDKRVNLRIHIG